MNDTINQFIKVVQESSLLSAVQKQEFLDQPELFPQAYRETIMRILERFEDQQRIRYRKAATIASAALQSLDQNLNQNGIDTEEKQRVMTQAKSALYPILSAPAA